MTQVEMAGALGALALIIVLIGLVALVRCEPQDIRKILRELLRRRN